MPRVVPPTGPAPPAPGQADLLGPGGLLEKEVGDDEEGSSGEEEERTGEEREAEPGGSTR